MERVFLMESGNSPCCEIKPLNELNPDERRLLNRVAREQMKKKLLADIRTDLMICDIEGWNKMEYLNELKELINQIGKN